ncbi:MAG: neutral zinc metallopeptidase [Candidatus Nanopelagicales bacterium]
MQPVGCDLGLPDCLLVKAFNETDEVWDAEFARLGQDYAAPSLTFFDGSVQTACGPATTAVGPFYCPGDQNIYFDLGFANQLKQLGVQGDYANIYIMAHEFGHHLQNITGIESEVRRLQSEDRANANAYGVEMELQADCFAGAWGRMADDRGNVTITRAELKEAQDAAEAVGDDRIQEQSGMRVNPESWTHGSAQQRREWYLTGYNSGDINRCNTLAQR